ncbi:eukaryotic translation initiation factor 3 subunit 8 N-terminus-domain-containing protein [Mycena rebaudengoi]|nr:eukaryotic translation initiation factor 3 subunit 8 N-terminus-domain-containing protein [Mycena rebaudengoi]
MSHLQVSIHYADFATQIPYNRTVVQLGLCAFRCGLIKEAQATLLDIFTTQRVKELLAQASLRTRFGRCWNKMKRLSTLRWAEPAGGEIGRTGLD